MTIKWVLTYIDIEENTNLTDERKDKIWFIHLQMFIKSSRK